LEIIMRIEPNSTVVGQLHAQIIREHVCITAGFVKNRAATGVGHAMFALGAATGYARGFSRGLFSGKSTPVTLPQHQWETSMLMT
jgi:hypothetical protein